MATNTVDKHDMVTGLFYDRDSAERAYQGLSDRGYTRDDVNLVMSDDTRKKHFSDTGTTTELGNKAAEGAGIGGAVGGTLGAIVAGVAAAGTSLVIPGLGLVVAGPLAAAAAGAGAGAATGGLLGALVGWGIPEERVKHYESGLKQGGILMGVRPKSADDAAYLAQHWRANNGMHVWRSGDNLTDSNSESTADNTVVAVYDNFADADAAAQALLADGFARSDVQLNPERDDMGTTASGVSDTNESTTGIRGFFYNLFGGDNRTNHDVYAESVRRGSYVLTVNTSNEDEVERATSIMSRHHAIDVDERTHFWKEQGWTGYDENAPRYTQDQIADERNRYAQMRAPGTAATADATTATTASTVTPGTTAGTTMATGETTRIPVVEEELKVGKRSVDRGGIRVFKRVSERPVEESVQLREERVKVERQPVDKPATAADLAAFKEGAIELREKAEEAVVSKTARVVEEVVVGKEVTQRTEHIDDTVRRTEVDVERLDAGGTARTATTSAATDDTTDFRRHWQSTYGSSGGRYEDYDAAYRYGSTAAGSDRYGSNYRWEEAEPNMRTDWERTHPESAWEKVKDAVRYGAERVTGHRH